MAAKIELDSSCMAEINKILGKVAILDRHPAMKKGLRKGAQLFRARYAAVLPQAGAPDDRGHTPLSKSIAVKLLDKSDDFITAIVGEKQDEKTHYHAHFVEGGFTVKGKQIAGKKYGERALASSTSDIDRAIIEGVNLAVKGLA